MSGTEHYEIRLPKSWMKILAVIVVVALLVCLVVKTSEISDSQTKLGKKVDGISKQLTALNSTLFVVNTSKSTAKTVSSPTLKPTTTPKASPSPTPTKPPAVQPKSVYILDLGGASDADATQSLWLCSSTNETSVLTSDNVSYRTFKTVQDSETLKVDFCLKDASLGKNNSNALPVMVEIDYQDVYPSGATLDLAIKYNATKSFNYKIINGGSNDHNWRIFRVTIPKQTAYIDKNGVLKLTFSVSNLKTLEPKLVLARIQIVKLT